ncbi:AAC(3) family N-acetyltransferase [Actinoplanes sp. NEAU-A12]|uniref:Aminoglycoside N(3)-acetyltransferase n=1 Tax=Actinoplanes sandaracinus TaxID=3045177 RepID=A0ABT6WZB1_9ACTN|nr:AAC(3) family N-acetyltransferase [Actinoplanes sandaracinus]MDI6105086.1 AAC(3) family N-acetyltransferase [Actinoplanes sandaracinus]
MTEDLSRPATPEQQPDEPGQQQPAAGALEREQAMPHTAVSLAADLRALGLAAGDTVLVHAALRSLGFVAGSAHAVVLALLDVLGPEGTLVVPTHTSYNSDPAGWSNPPVPESWWPVIRRENPGFDPVLSLSRWMGVLAETVRTWPGAMRSSHPQVSFAALGARAAEIVGTHPVEDELGDGSPLGAVYRLGGKVLLLGCGHANNTSLHLSECRQEQPKMDANGAAVRDVDGVVRWVTWTAPATDSGDFAELGAAFDVVGPVAMGKVGNATARLMPQRDLVDFGVGWIREHRR